MIRVTTKIYNFHILQTTMKKTIDLNNIGDTLNILFIAAQILKIN